jgi:hypothetical protein
LPRPQTLPQLQPQPQRQQRQLEVELQPQPQRLLLPQVCPLLLRSQSLPP